MVDRQAVGRRLIIFAWGVEIIAAFIGVTIAALVVFSTAEQIQAAGIRAPEYLDMFLGGLPFIVVAMVELTKIPLATATYTVVSRVWKAFLATALVVLSIITFQTILNGFERNFTQRTYILTTLKKQLTGFDEQIGKTEQDLRDLSQTDEDAIRKAYVTDIGQIDREKQTALEEIEKEKNDARVRYGGEEAKVKDAELKTVEEDLTKLDAFRNAEIARINERYKLQTERTDVLVRERQVTLNQQIKELELRLADSHKREQEQVARVREGGDVSGQLTQAISDIEKDFAARTTAVRQETEKTRATLDSQLGSLNAKIDAIESEKARRIEQAGIFTDTVALRRDYDARLQPLMSERAKLLEDQRVKLSVEDKLAALNAEKDRALTRARDHFAEMGSKAEREREGIRSRFASEREADTQQLQTLRREIASLSTGQQIERATATRDDELKRLTRDGETQRATLLERRGKSNKELSDILVRRKDHLEPILQRLDERRESVSQRSQVLHQEAEKRFQAQLARLSDRDAEMRRKEVALTELRDKRINLREEISRKAQDDQIYRVTALWAGKDSAADITNAELRIVSIVWFGSLAAITAWTGTVLAFGGLVVRYGPQERSPERSSPLSRAIRAFLVDWRRRVRRPIIKTIEREVVKPVEVIKEVPVDRVVFKEVPKEIIRKELVYVPMFTDDPNLMREQGVRHAGNGGHQPSGKESGGNGHK